MKAKKAKDRIIIALDVDDHSQLLKLVHDLAEHVGMFKIGLGTIHGPGGSQLVRAIKSLGGSVFYDAKINDTTHQMGLAAAAISRHKGVRLFTAMASAGVDGLLAAAEQKGDALMLAVTVLTSMDEKACASSYNLSVREAVLNFAFMAAEGGADGIVCSPQDLHALKDYPTFSHLKKVTPGVRPEWAAVGDQKRVMTPRQAVQAGADWLVIGRPITNPPEGMSPLEAVKRIIDEIEAA